MPNVPPGEIEDIHTDKYYVDYEGPHGEHTFLLRMASGTVSGTALARVAAFVNAIKGFVFTGTVFNQVRFSAAASKVSFPTTWTPITATSGITHTEALHPRFMSFVGRDSANVRTRIMLLGATPAVDADYRLLETEVSGSLDAAFTALRSTTTPFLTVNGLVPFWAPYVNTGYHAYFQRKRRRIG